MSYLGHLKFIDILICTLNRIIDEIHMTVDKINGIS